MRRALLLPPMLRALDAWLADPTPAGADALSREIDGVARLLDLGLTRLDVAAPPLPELAFERDGARAGTDHELRSPTGDVRIGTARLTGDAEQAATFARALEFAFVAAQARATADRAGRQLTALDQAVRGISGVLDVDRVLQLIADRVRDLVEAEYAAIGIVDGDGAIERFITSGITARERARIGDLPHGRGLLGLIIRENRTVRIPEIAEHPASYGFPPHHPTMHAFLGMPILSRGVPVGRLYLTNKRGAAEFSSEDQALVEMFALHAGIAIENARLHDQVRRLAVVDERDRISRDLHDSVIQAIYAQTLALDDVPDLIAEDAPEAERRVDEAIESLHAVISDIRNFIFGLRPVLLESGSIEEGLRHLATELRRSAAVEVGVSVEDPAEALPALPIELVAELLAITREALSNVARHAAATTASVRATMADEELRLEIEDDGRGFDVRRAAERGHHGLANMRARTGAVGGTFELTSTAGVGTRIIVSIPRRPAGPDGGGS
jgi:signal transduction histidine kinase